MVAERLLLFGKLAFMNQPVQNSLSTLALGGKGPCWAALNFQEQSGLPFRRRVNGDVFWTLQNPDNSYAAVEPTIEKEPLMKTRSALEGCRQAVAANSKVKKAFNQPSIAVRIT